MPPLTTRRAVGNAWIARMRRANPALRTRVLAWAADGKPLTIGLYDPATTTTTMATITVDDALQAP